jgi:ABC-2 type transport system permease protein
LGLLMAGTLKGTINLALCNGLYLVLLLFGGIVVPPEKLPGSLGGLAHVLPSGALADVLFGALTPGAPISATAWVALLAWAVALPLLAVRLFRWE